MCKDVGGCSVPWKTAYGSSLVQSHEKRSIMLSKCGLSYAVLKRIIDKLVAPEIVSSMYNDV